MKPINNWENVQAPSTIENLPAGAYVCDIKKVTLCDNKSGNGQHLKFEFDICEGDYKDFFAKDYRSQTREDKFWNGVIRQNIPEESDAKYEIKAGFFKRVFDYIEESNPGYRWDWNEAGLKGKKIGVTFGEKEKMSQRGNIYTITESREIISVDNARTGNFRAPEKKTLTTNANAVASFANTTIDDGSDLPF